MPFSKYIKYARSFNLLTCFQIGLIFCNRNLETFSVPFRPKQNLITALQTDIIYGYVVHTYLAILRRKLIKRCKLQKFTNANNLLGVNDIRPPRKWASVIISVRTCGVFRVYQDKDSGVPLPPPPPPPRPCSLFW